MQQVRAGTGSKARALPNSCRTIQADGGIVDDLELLRAPVEVSLGTGVRKITELLGLRIENVNFTGLAIFRRANGRDVEVRPNWFLLVDTKGKGPRHRLIPMNAPVRTALSKVIQ